MEHWSKATGFQNTKVLAVPNKQYRKQNGDVLRNVSRPANSLVHFTVSSIVQKVQLGVERGLMWEPPPQPSKIKSIINYKIAIKHLFTVVFWDLWRQWRLFSKYRRCSLEHCLGCTIQVEFACSFSACTSFSTSMRGQEVNWSHHEVNKFRDNQSAVRYGLKLLHSPGPVHVFWGMGKSVPASAYSFWIFNCLAYFQPITTAFLYTSVLKSTYKVE